MLEDIDLDLLRGAMLAGQIGVAAYLLAIAWLTANHPEKEH